MIVTEILCNVAVETKGNVRAPSQGKEVVQQFKIGRKESTNRGLNLKGKGNFEVKHNYGITSKEQLKHGTSKALGLILKL